MSTNHATRTTATAVLTAAVLALGAGPAAAGPRLTLSGTGTTAVPAAGPATYAGEVYGTPFGGRYSGELAAADGTLPAVGECEAATATLRVEADGGRHVTLRSEGQVCAVIVPWVKQAFDGRFTVVDTDVRKLRRVTGVMQVRLSDSLDLSDVYATG